jgi:N-methylhydantoinase A
MIEKREAMPGLRVGIDIGGTFTDLIACDHTGKVWTAKVLSTPGDFSEGILRGLDALFSVSAALGEKADIDRLFHATTVATNSILEEKGAKTALITTRGFRDVLELRRIRIPELYNFFLDKPPPMVLRRHRYEVRERINAAGTVTIPLDIHELDQLLDQIASEDIEALAICLLHSYANPDHEHRIAERARKRLRKSLFITCSAELVPEIREYERTSTTVINATVGPVMHNYLTNLTFRLRGAGISAQLQVMMSNGGLTSASMAMERPATMVESGPAAGVIASAHLAKICGLDNVITLDMGGTTAKAGIIEDGMVARTSEYEVGAGINVSSQLVKGRGHALKLPVIDLSEIGAGGGSIATIDQNGLLKVGPQSAGADPGPACYGRQGKHATLTDAMVVLGYLNPNAIAGGRIPIGKEAAQKVIFERIAAPLGNMLEHAAFGIYLIATAAMTRAVKAISTFRGRDPREFDLIAFGGNGPLMAAQIADELMMRRILIPHHAGVFSAFGLLVGNTEHEFSQTLVRRSPGITAQEVKDAFAALEEKARSALKVDGYSDDPLRLRRLADLRYSGQAYELTVDVEGGDITGESIENIFQQFHREHERTYGHANLNEPVDLVGVRVQASPVVTDEIPYGKDWRTALGADGSSPVYREAYFGQEVGFLTVPVFGRAALAVEPSPGPIIIEELESTCVVPPQWSVAIDSHGNIVLERRP